MYRHLEGVIFDWAGTTVDFGCFAPVNVFISIFSESGIEVTLKEAREPMGMLKRDHIEAMLTMERISRLWEEKYNRPFDQKDVDALYAKFEPQLMATLKNFGTPIESVVETFDAIKAKGLKVGSTTGYTDKMIAVVSEVAETKGYKPDTIVTPDSTGQVGRPKPYMVFENMRRLNLTAPWRIVKVGDTISDIREGVNAGCWTVGIAVGSSQMGMCETDFNALDSNGKKRRIDESKESFMASGADFVIETMADLPKLLETIDQLLEEGKRPHAFK